MIRTHKRLLTSLLAGVAATALALPAAAQELTVMFGGDPIWVETYNAAAARFQEANPGVTVNMVHTPHGAYNEKFASMVMSGDLPDVTQVDAPYLANYVWSGLLQPIEPLLDPEVVAQMTPSNRAQSTYPIDNQLYATSLIDSTVVLYGNRRYLEAIGARIPTSVADAWTADEFEKILTDLAALEEVEWPIDLFRAFGARSEWVTYAWSPIFQSYGCDLIDRSTWTATGTLDSEACITAGQTMQRWSSNNWVVPGTAATNVFYAEGQKAGLAWGARTYYVEAQKAMGDDVVALPLPKFGEKSVSPNGTWIWGVTTSAKDPQLAGKFISHLVNDEGYRTLARDTGQTPALASFVAASPLYAPGGPMAIAIDQGANSAVARPPHPAYPAITEAFKTAMDGILSGADVAGELRKAAQAIDLEIEDNDGFAPFNAASQ